MPSIKATNEAGDYGRIDWGDGTVSTGPLPPQSDELLARYEALIAGGVVVEPFVPVDPVEEEYQNAVMRVPQLVACVLCMEPIPAEYTVYVAKQPFNVIAVIYMDVGEYFVMFANALPDDDYIVSTMGGSMSISVPAETKTASEFLLKVTGADGVTPLDPVSMGIQVHR